MLGLGVFIINFGYCKRPKVRRDEDLYCRIYSLHKENVNRSNIFMTSSCTNLTHNLSIVNNGNKSPINLFTTCNFEYVKWDTFSTLLATQCAQSLGFRPLQTPQPTFQLLCDALPWYS